MNLLQRVVHRKSFGRNTKERPASSPYSNSWSEGAPAENDSIILGGSPHASPISEIPPPLPAHRSPTSDQKSFFQRPASNGALRRSSAISHRRHSTLALGEENDDDKLMRDSMEAMRRLGGSDSPSPQISLPSVRQQPLLALGDDDNHESSGLMRDTTNALGGLPEDLPRARKSWLMPSTVSSYSVEASRPPPPVEKDSSFVVLPRYPATEPKEDNLFDSAQLASQWAETPSRPEPAPAQKGKVMTTAQFEKYRADQERLKSVGYKKAESVVDDEEDNYDDDDEDEEEKRREQARQRRKQEAHMTVYRQQMMKITGDASAASQRPGMITSQSTPNLSLGTDMPDPEDEDEDIPLAILQAHGFPNRSRGPGQLNGMSSNPNLRASSQARTNGPGSVVGGADGRASMLPAFARRLPQDPYNYGAAIVNPTNRESLAFGAGSLYGGGPRPVAGGLVGVIANEERSRAMRRGSPNAQGEYPAMPSNMTANRQSAMGGPMMQAPGMPYPTDPAQMQAQMAQMQAQLQQSMEMQMQFFNMVTGAPPPPMQGMAGSQGPGSVYGMPPSQQGFPRASTMGNMQSVNSNFLGVDNQSRPGSAQNGRPFTVADPNFASMGGNRGSFMPTGGNGYASSITPSERSNIGQPGRYRPVSHLPQSSVDPGRTSTMMSGGAGGWNNPRTNLNGSLKPAAPTVRVLPIEKEAEEDEEKAWEEMRLKQAKKKSLWKSRKQDYDLGDVAQFTN